MEDLKNKRILVTGASSGIGDAIARGFGAAGATVAVHYHRSEQGANDVVAAIKRSGSSAIAIGSDLASDGGATAMVEQCHSVVAHARWWSDHQYIINRGIYRRRRRNGPLCREQRVHQFADSRAGP